MSFVIVAIIAVAVFLVCAWSGQTLAQHHQDRQEVTAVIAIGVCVLGTLALSRNLLDVDGMLPLLGLAVAAGGGLFLGFDRADRVP